MGNHNNDTDKEVIRKHDAERIAMLTDATVTVIANTATEAGLCESCVAINIAGELLRTQTELLEESPEARYGLIEYALKMLGCKTISTENGQTITLH